MDQVLYIPWDDKLTSDDFRRGHPLAPVRVELTMSLARQLGVFDAPGVTLAPVWPAEDALVELVHAPDYLHAVRNAAQIGYAERVGFGLGTEDNPVFPGMHGAAALVVGASVAAADAVWSGVARHGANMAGGLHHAVDVVPRIWAHVLAEAAHRPIAPQTETPAAWRRHAAERTGRRAPVTMTDGRDPLLRSWANGYDPADRADQAVLAARREVFPYHGLDPMP
ncbi:MAG TPA: hypothetical protein VGX23_05035 [Actinocrinis sp.]|nr:hypothetical protein [Actinocrinis sp.]